uniref:Uncharacterized protein n=1 Tax=Arundo donax TaxID=35708 RepID=A0A0A9GBS1_ARUDO
MQSTKSSSIDKDSFRTSTVQIKEWTLMSIEQPILGILRHEKEQEVHNPQKQQ